VKATLAQIPEAVEASLAYIALNDASVQECIDTVCDHLGVVTDVDRRVMRRAVQKRKRAPGAKKARRVAR
jgi:hypothetical protein